MALKGVNRDMIKKCSICIVVIFGVLSVCAGELTTKIKETLCDNWEDVSEWCDEIVNLKKDLPSLPESSWWRRDRKKQRQIIYRAQQKIRKTLLSLDSCELLKNVAKCDSKLQALRKEIDLLREEAGFNPDCKNKIEKKIAKIEHKFSELGRRRKVEVEKIRKELESIGMKLNEKTFENFLMLANQQDLTDNIIVAKGVFDIVESLKDALNSGNVSSSMRYYGIYVVLMDLQIECYNEYLFKSRDVWRKKLEQYKVEVSSTIERCQRNITGGVYGARDVEVLNRLIGSNQKLLSAIDIYGKFIVSCEEIIHKRLRQTELRRELAQCSFETSSNAATLMSLIQESQSEFSSLMELELPDIKEFADSLVEDQIRAITLRLEGQS